MTAPMKSSPKVEGAAPDGVLLILSVLSGILFLLSGLLPLLGSHPVIFDGLYSRSAGLTYLFYLILVLAGGVLTYLSFGLWKGSQSAWSGSVIFGILGAVLGFLTAISGTVLAGVGAVVGLLFLFRLHSERLRFGVKTAEVLRIEKANRSEWEMTRRSNPDGHTCPRCGSRNLWVSPDNSASCLECKYGILDVTKKATPLGRPASDS